jgi:hypothetical protein
VAHPTHRMYSLAQLIGCLWLMGCAHQQDIGLYRPHPANLSHCKGIEESIDLHDRIGTLNHLSHAFDDRCYETVIKYGTRAQTEYRHKTFSMMKEAGSLLVQDGVLTDYTLESYERGFLTFLLSASYYQLHKPTDAEVELRRLDNELFAVIYNFGEDPVNILLSAALWEKLGETAEARVDWNQLQGRKEPPKDTRTKTNDPIRAFGSKRVDAIDSGKTIRSAWKLYAIGQFPDVEWDLKFISSSDGYFSVTAHPPFLPDCSSDTGVRISTQSWFHKIAIRHSNDYHPLLNVQSWIRLPFGLVYSIVPLTAGAGIAVGGCVLDAYGHGNGSFCEISIKGGVAMMEESPKVLKGTVQPDLRHWEYLPSSFLLTTADDLNDEKCFANLPEGLGKRETFKILE